MSELDTLVLAVGVGALGVGARGVLAAGLLAGGLLAGGGELGGGYRTSTVSAARSTPEGAGCEGAASIGRTGAS